MMRSVKWCISRTREFQGCIWPIPVSWYWFCPHSPSILLFFQKGRTREESDNHTGFEQFSRLAKGIKKRLKRQTVKVQLLWLVQCHAHSAVGFFLSIHVFMSTFFVNKCWMLSVSVAMAAAACYYRLLLRIAPATLLRLMPRSDRPISVKSWDRCTVRATQLSVL